MDTKYFLSQLFQESDYFYLCGQVKLEGGNEKPRMACLSDLDAKLLPEHQFVCLNPLSIENKNLKSDVSKGSYRASVNVTRLNAFLFESDILPLEVQQRLVPILAKEVPIKFATLSGGKSIHLLVVMADSLTNVVNIEDLKSVYKQYWNAIAYKMENIISEFLKLECQQLASGGQYFDRACADLVRLTRLGGAIRSSGTHQTVIYEGNYATSDFLASLANRIIIDNSPKHKVEMNDSLDYAEFKKILKSKESGLGFKLFHAEAWAGSAGNYPLIYKYTLWAIDRCGVPKSTFIKFFDNHVTPVLSAIGYKSDPHLGINDAYRKVGQ